MDGLGTTEKRECYGVLDKVFPMGDEGMREVPPRCQECSGRVACLRTAMSTPEGIALRAEMGNRAPAKGIWGRLQAWSMRKELYRMKKERKHRE
jgi:hypothetical protein